MRLEHDELGVSVFIENHIVWQDLVASLALPGAVLLAFGLAGTLIGLVWIGPALMFVGIALLISVPLTLEDHTHEVCTFLRFDHLGLKVPGRRVNHIGRVECFERGVLLHADRPIYVPVRDPRAQQELVELIEETRERFSDEIEVPDALRQLRQQVFVQG